MAQLEHPCIVRLVTAELQAINGRAFEVHIFMEYCEGGDLFQRMKKFPQMQPSDVLKTVDCIASALSFMHSRDMIHRDVKPSNVLLTGMDADVTYKLADFGLARADRSSVSTRGVAGTLFYMSPDAFNGSGGKPVDVFALGRLAFEAATCSAPVVMINTPEQVEALVKELPAAYEFQTQLFASMMCMEPGGRPTADQVERQLKAEGDDCIPQCIDLGADCSPEDRQATMMKLGAQLKTAPWRRHVQVPGLQWQEETGHVRVCRFRPGGCSTPEATAFDELSRMIEQSPSCGGFSEKYACQEVVLSSSKSREVALLATIWNLEAQYSTNPHLYDLTSRLGSASSEHGIWRRKILDYFKQYPNMADEAVQTRVCIGFHAAPSMEVANSIMKGNFAKLAKLDEGFIGSGVYVTFDLDYAFEEYGVNFYGLEEVPVIVCAVVVGNPLPVIECPECDPANGKCFGACSESYCGKAIVARSGAHIAVMGKDPANHDFGKNPLPAHPSRWSAIDPVTEICVNEDKIVPLGVLLMRKATCEATHERQSTAPQRAAQCPQLEAGFQSGPRDV